MGEEGQHVVKVISLNSLRFLYLYNGEMISVSWGYSEGR